jgi:hypothetical protein
LKQHKSIAIDTNGKILVDGTFVVLESNIEITQLIANGINTSTMEFGVRLSSSTGPDNITFEEAM